MTSANSRAWKIDDGRRHRVAEKRAQILRAAQLVFLRNGYERASMDAVADEAGVAKMTIYRQFGDKRSLFIACMNDRCRDMLVPERYPVAQSLDEAKASLVDYGYVVFDLITQHDIILLYRILISQAGGFDDLAGIFYQQGPAQAYTVIEKIIGELFDPEEAAIRARTFFWASLGDAYQRVILGLDTSAEARTLFAQQIILTVDRIFRS